MRIYEITQRTLTEKTNKIVNLTAINKNLLASSEKTNQQNKKYSSQISDLKAKLQVLEIQKQQVEITNEKNKELHNKLNVVESEYTELKNNFDQKIQEEKIKYEQLHSEYILKLERERDLYAQKLSNVNEQAKTYAINAYLHIENLKNQHEEQLRDQIRFFSRAILLQNEDSLTIPTNWYKIPPEFLVPTYHIFNFCQQHQKEYVDSGRIFTDSMLQKAAHMCNNLYFDILGTDDAMKNFHEKFYDATEARVQEHDQHNDCSEMMLQITHSIPKRSNLKNFRENYPFFYLPTFLGKYLDLVANNIEYIVYFSSIPKNDQNIDYIPRLAVIWDMFFENRIFKEIIVLFIIHSKHKLIRRK